MRTRADTQVNQIVGESSRVSAALGLLLQMINAIFFVVVYAVIALAATWQVVTLLLVFGIAIYLVTRPLSRPGPRVGQQVTGVSQALIHRATVFLSGGKPDKATAAQTATTRLFSK